MATTRSTELMNEMLIAGDKNGCGPIALALLTDTNLAGSAYGRARAALAAQGRHTGKGTPMYMTRRAFRHRGFHLVDVTCDLRDLGAKTVQSLAWTLKKHDMMGKYLIRVRGHVCAAMGGIVHDWSSGTKKHLLEVYEVSEIYRGEDFTDQELYNNVE